MKKIHCILKSENTTLQTWLDADLRIKRGVEVRLKDYMPETWWIVQSCADPVDIPMSAQTRSEKFYEHDSHIRHGGLKYN